MPATKARKPVVTILALLLGLFTLVYLAARANSAVGRMGSTPAPAFKYETVAGYFMQDEADVETMTFDYTKHNFGLIERKYDTDEDGDERLTQWQRFEKYIKHLAGSDPKSINHKVIYLGRHGEGYHNLGEAKYGTKAWDDYWSKLDGDGELYWFDAHLTDHGKDQALHNNAFFRSQFAEAKMPAPEKYFTSPLYRCLQTANLTYFGLEAPAERPFKPVVKELMREIMGEHTCDKRSTRNVIHDAMPEWEIEAGFTEEDELWQADHRETFEEHDARTQKLLDDIFENDQHVFISFTSHSGAIASLLRVIEHRQFRLPTGGMMPVLIKATRIV